MISDVWMHTKEAEVYGHSFVKLFPDYYQFSFACLVL